MEEMTTEEIDERLDAGEGASGVQHALDASAVRRLGLEHRRVNVGSPNRAGGSRGALSRSRASPASFTGPGENVPGYFPLW